MEGRHVTQGSPFDHRPDSALGSALREALTADGEAPFVQRVLAAAESSLWTGQVVPWWSVLTGWARPGLVAALVVATLTGFALGAMLGHAPSSSSEFTLGEPLRSESEQLAVPLLLSGRAVPTADEALAVAMGR